MKEIKDGVIPARFRNKRKSLYGGFNNIVVKVKDGNAIVGYLVSCRSDSGKESGYRYQDMDLFEKGVKRGMFYNLVYDLDKKEVVGKDFDFKRYKKDLSSVQLRNIKSIQSNDKSILLVPMRLERREDAVVYIIFCMFAASYTLSEYESKLRSLVSRPESTNNSVCISHCGKMMYLVIPIDYRNDLGVYPFSFIVDSDSFVNKYNKTSVSNLSRKIASSLNNYSVK